MTTETEPSTLNYCEKHSWQNAFPGDHSCPYCHETARHTPGPWRVVRSACGHTYVEKNFDTIATVRDTPSGGLNDALLIAAAPELLEALENLERAVSGDMPTGYQLKAARAAIAKAKGA